MRPTLSPNSRVAAGLASTTLSVAASTIEHRLGRGLEQQPVARLDMAQARIVALHRHLRFDQPLLQRRERAQVAADRHEAIALPMLDDRIENGNFGAASTSDG